MEVEKRSNGNGTVVEEEDEGRRTIFSSIVSEKSLCLSLFIISLGVVVAKLFINYDTVALSLSLKSASEEKLKLAADKLMVQEVIGDYGWLLKAGLCGLTMISFTWFIIYEDSYIPGVNPPSPFSPTKNRMTRTTDSLKMPLNYFVGVLNGLLIFVFMCL